MPTPPQRMKGPTNFNPFVLFHQATEPAPVVGLVLIPFPKKKNSPNYKFDVTYFTSKLGTGR